MTTRSQCRACGQELEDRLGQLCVECTAAAWENDGDRYLWEGPEADQVRKWADEDVIARGGPASRHPLGRKWAFEAEVERLEQEERAWEYREATDPMQDRWHEDRPFPGQSIE